MMSIPRIRFLSLTVFSLLLITGVPLTMEIDAVEIAQSRTSTVRGGPDEDSWPMYKGDLNHTGFSLSRIPMDRGTEELWYASIPSLKQTNSPVVGGGMVFLGSGDGRIRGFDIDTGSVVWEVRATNKHISTPVTIDGGSLYFGADDGHVYGYDISTKIRFLDVNLNTTAIFAAPTVADNMLYIGTTGRNLMNARFYCVNIQENNISWSYNMGDVINIYGFSGTAAYYQGKVYIGDGRWNVYCFDSDGFSDGNDGPYTSETDPVIGEADIIWKFNATSSLVGSPLLAEGRVFIGNDIGVLYSLDAMDGSKAWQRQIGAGEPPSIQSSPSYHNGVLYAAAQRVWGPYNDNKGGSIWAIDASDNNMIWRYNTTGQMLKSSPVIVEGALVFGAGAGNTSIICIKTSRENIANDDRVLWYYNTGAPIWSASAVADGRVFVSRPDGTGSTGKLFVLGSPDPEITGISISDPMPFIGEVVNIRTDLKNNGTVDATVDIQFKVSTYDNQKQELVGVLEDVMIEASSERQVVIDWVVKDGFDMLVAIFTRVTPDDKDIMNNFATTDIYVNKILTEGWLSSGGGPGRTGYSSMSLESNRTYWERSLEGMWTGPGEAMFYGSFTGNGTISSAGGILYLAGPRGSLMAMNSTPGENGKVGMLWAYSNSSVNFIGRPVLLVDSARTLGGSNKVFAYGDDGALWAFDWVGFRDSKNDGPFTWETASGPLSGDVIWRTPLPDHPAQPIFISGGNVIVPLTGGEVAAFDDDTGAQVWKRMVSAPHTAYAADTVSIFTQQGGDLLTIDPHNGSVILRQDISALIQGHTARSMVYENGKIILAFNDTVALFDAYPDDNGDGVVDGDDEDLGLEDNGTGHDIIWSTSLLSRVGSPPTVSIEGNTISLTASDLLVMLDYSNGTVMDIISLPETPAGRVVSGGDSFYLFTGVGPWTLRAYSPGDSGGYTDTWTQLYSSEPRGEPALVMGQMFVSTRDGMVRSIGASNNPPVAVISAPGEGVLLFPGEMITLDASASYDLDDDPMTFYWYLEGSDEVVYQGPEPVVQTSLQGVGSNSLVLRVYDDMKAYGERSVNVTLLKRITSPDYSDFFNDIYVRMSFGISEPSGAYFINSTVPAEYPPAPGAVFITHMEFTPLPKYASYRFEWANVSMGFKGKEFPIAMHQDKLCLYYFDDDLQQWERAPISGVRLNDSMVYGNFSDLKAGFYAIGILDNSVPEFMHDPDINVFRQIDENVYTFKVEYRDSDGNVPRSIKLHLDDLQEYELEVEGFQGSVVHYTTYFVEDVELSPSWHSYYFEADDGFFIARSRSYEVSILNSPPVAVIVPPSDGILKVRENYQFSAEGSFDPDGDQLTYSWDFDNKGDGLDRDAIGKAVGHTFYTPGIYNVTLTVSDGETETQRTIIVTVIDEAEEDTIEPWLLIGLVVVLAILIVAVVIFIVLSKKGHEEQNEMSKLAEETWDCPECGRTISKTVEECPACGYEYDPLDLEDEDLDEM